MSIYEIAWAILSSYAFFFAAIGKLKLPEKKEKVPIEPTRCDDLQCCPPPFEQPNYANGIRLRDGVVIVDY